jgi:hypothetical protein
VNRSENAPQPSSLGDLYCQGRRHRGNRFRTESSLPKGADSGAAARHNSAACWLLMLLVAPLAPSAFAQVTAAKPSSFVLNSGATYYPDHLWMVDEGSGTTLDDEIGSWDLTLTGADWGTDPTHGPKLTFVAANSDRIQRTGLTLSGNQSWCGVWKKGADPGATQSLMNYGDSAADTNLGTKVATTGVLVRAARQAGSGASGNSSYDLVAAASWQVVCGVGNDTTVGVSMQGANLSSTGHAFTGLVASLDKFTAGCESDNTLDQCTDAELVALWTYEATLLNNTDLAAIGVANPWPVIGLVADAAWTVPPSVTGTTSSSYTVAFTTNVDATVYGVACNPGVPNPTAAEVIGGLCDTALPAAATCTESVTGGVPDTCVLGGVVWPEHDLHVIACPEAGIC